MSSPEQADSEGEQPKAGEEEDRQAEPTGGQATGGEQEELRPLDVYMVLRAAATQLAAAAWQMLGLQADPFTGAVRKDMEQARVAIDSTAYLVEKLLPHLAGQEARDYQNLLTDLRLNFAKQAGEAKGE
jgi:hypothetical protein